MSLLKGKGPILLGALALGAIAYSAFTFLSKKSGTSNDDDLLPALTQEEAEDAMTKISVKLNGLTKRLIDAAENIKAQIRQQGHEIDDQTVYKSYILVHFESGFRDIQESVLAEIDCEESELEEAVSYYQSHGSVILQDISQKIRKIYKQFGGQLDNESNDNIPQSEKSKSMNVDDVLEILNALNDKIMTASDGFITKFKEEYGIPNSEMLSGIFNQGLMTIASSAEEAVLSSAGVTSEEFQQVVLKFQEAPLINRAILSMQETQHKLLLKHGLMANAPF